MEEGELRKRILSVIDEDDKSGKGLNEFKIWEILREAKKEYPKVSQVQLLAKGTHVDWKRICRQMEQKIIAFENFGKKWFGGENE